MELRKKKQIRSVEQESEFGCGYKIWSHANACHRKIVRPTVLFWKILSVRQFLFINRVLLFYGTGSVVCMHVIQNVDFKNSSALPIHFYSSFYLRLFLNKNNFVTTFMDDTMSKARSM